MLSKATEFEFSAYHLSKEKKEITFDYQIKFQSSESLSFTEKIFLPSSLLWKNISEPLFDRILQQIHLVLGISYWKMFAPSKIVIKTTKLNQKQAQFWNTVYTKGLGEFFYRNKIKDFSQLINFPYRPQVKNQPIPYSRQNRALVAVGGGKDSIVTIEFLKKQNLPITGTVVETGKPYPLITKVIQQANINFLIIKRIPDPKLFELSKKSNIYKGHVPISAIYAFLDLLAAVIYDYRYIIFSNEKSADENNVEKDGQAINHQWSKSSEFELLFNSYVKNYITPDIKYFSLLRPLYELKIAQYFSQFPQYFPIFASCNRNFSITNPNPHNHWCGVCAKCASVFLLLASFIKKDDLVKIFAKNLFKDEKLIPLYKQLIGLESPKPFDCVATIDESRLALSLIWKKQEYQDSPIIKLFEKEILPRFKNIDSLKQKILSIGSLDNLPEQFKFLLAKKVLILGYGQEGRATEKFLKTRYPKIAVEIADQKFSTNYLDHQKDFDLVVKSPGIAKEKVTVSYTTATNIFFANTNNLIIGITGSKGKSTTASLIYHILRTANKKVRLIGNIGKPALLELLNPVDKDIIFVAELSSYQLDDIKYSPHIAVITNLFPEHMNYHGDIDRYFLAKKNIIRFQTKNDYFIFNQKNIILTKWTKETTSQVLSFDPLIKLELSNNPLLGKHNLDNIQAAITVGHLLRIEDKTIVQSIKTFKPLPHRLQFIGRFKNIDFYDDAISTAPESAIAAIETLKNIGVIFLGGEDRGYNFNILVKILAQYQIPNIVLFPQTGTKIYDLILKESNYKPNIFQTTSMEEAVKFAYKQTPKNSICLLSTASPSYSLWKNFEEKGDQFKFFAHKYSK